MTTARNTGSATRAKNAENKRRAIIENIEWLIECRVGEAAILTGIGYTKKPRSLQRLLAREGRHDLIPRIFEWQAETDARQHPKKAA